MSETKSDGGSIHPTTVKVRGEFVHLLGLTIRDYFAAAAVQGMLAYPGDVTRGSWHNNASPKGVASAAYEFADAMLAERVKQPCQK